MNYMQTKKMKDVFFKPWIGEKYGNIKPRIMILGESVYSEESLEEDFVDEMIYAIRNKTWSHPFFVKISKLINSTKMFKKKDDINIWDYVVFYEFVQDTLPKARVRPTKEQWQKSNEAFLAVLNEYKPDLVLCFGKEMYRKLPEFDGDVFQHYTVQHNLKKYHAECWIYKIKNKNILILEIKHPSTGFPYKPWIKIIDKCLADNNW